MNPDILSLPALLTWLAGSGVASWMLIWSNFIRNLKTESITPDQILYKFSQWVKKLSPAGLQALVIGGSFGLPVAAALILNFVPAEAIAAAAPIWQWAATLFTAFVGQQIWFKATKKD